jgi:hypothetical protein
MISFISESFGKTKTESILITYPSFIEMMQMSINYTYQKFEDEELQNMK